MRGSPQRPAPQPATHSSQPCIVTPPLVIPRGSAWIMAAVATTSFIGGEMAELLNGNTSWMDEEVCTMGVELCCRAALQAPREGATCLTRFLPRRPLRLALPGPEQPLVAAHHPKAPPCKDWARTRRRRCGRCGSVSHRPCTHIAPHPTPPSPPCSLHHCWCRCAGSAAGAEPAGGGAGAPVCGLAAGGGEGRGEEGHAGAGAHALN